MLKPRELDVAWFKEYMKREARKYPDFSFENDDADSDGIVSWSVRLSLLSGVAPHACGATGLTSHASCRFEFSLPKGDGPPAIVQLMADGSVYEAHYNPAPPGKKNGDPIEPGDSQRGSGSGKPVYDRLLQARAQKKRQGARRE